MESVNITSINVLLNKELLPMMEPVSVEFQVLPVRRLLICLSSILFWETIYQISRRKYQCNVDEASRFTAFIHSLHECLFVPFILFLYYEELFTFPTQHTACDVLPKSDYVLSIAAGYFLWDLTWLIRHFDKIWFLHCSLCLAIYFPALFVPYFQRQSICVLLYEVSTVVFHLFGYLEKFGFTKMEYLCRILFSLTFFIFRLILGNIMLFEVWDSTYSWLNIYYNENHNQCVPWICKGPVSFVIVAFQILNLYWFINIIKAFYETIFNKSKTD